jgi:predicted small metal-binding protein
MPMVIACACGVAVQGDTEDEVIDKAVEHQASHRDEGDPVPRDVLALMIETVE